MFRLTTIIIRIKAFRISYYFLVGEIMKAFFIFLIVVLSVFTLCVLFFAIESHKFFKTFLFNTFLGISVLAIIDLTAKFTGMYIPLNWYSVGGSAVFGIPAVILFLIMQIII